MRRKCALQALQRKKENSYCERKQLLHSPAVAETKTWGRVSLLAKAGLRAAAVALTVLPSSLCLPSLTELSKTGRNQMTEF